MRRGRPGVSPRKKPAHSLREVERRHRAMLRAVPDMMFVLDRRGTYLDFHAPDHAVLLVPPEEFLGKTVHDLFPSDLADRFVRCIGEALRAGTPQTMEYDLAAAGAITHWEARLAACDKDTVLCIVRDLTERRTAEAAARHLREGLARAGRVTALAALSGSLAHEINQPLASIMANAQAVLRLTATPGYDLAEVREALTDIVTEDRRAGEVLRRLRAVLAREAPRTETLDVQAMLQQILQLVRNEVALRRIDLDVHFAPDLPAVTGDRVQLQQAALNLLFNAFEAVQELGPGDRRVGIHAARQDGHVEIQVVDGGPGIPPDRMPLVFEPFYTTKPGGMGLGLPICQTIAGAHGGAVLVGRNPGGGMTFTLRLPSAS